MSAAELKAEIKTKAGELAVLRRRYTAAKKAEFTARDRAVANDLIAGLGYPYVMEKYGIAYMRAANIRHLHKMRRESP